MQTDHKQNSVGRASLSRRTFLQFAAAGPAATLPAVAIAGEGGKTARLSPQEAELSNLINHHAALLARINIVARQIEELANRPDKPARMIVLEEVAGRELDYMPPNLKLRFHAQRDIDRFFGRQLAQFENWPHGPEWPQRIRADWLTATDLFSRRITASQQWEQETGYREADEELERLFIERDSVEERISEMPCSSVRMVVLKARYAGEWEEERRENLDEFEALYLASILKSMLPLMEAQE